MHDKGREIRFPDFAGKSPTEAVESGMSDEEDH